MSSSMLSAGELRSSRFTANFVPGSLAVFVFGQRFTRLAAALVFGLAFGFSGSLFGGDRAIACRNPDVISMIKL